MTDPLVGALHTAARRFAMDAESHWVEHYFHSGASDRPNSEEALSIFPRYLVHAAMLGGIEAFSVEALPQDLDAARSALADAVMSAENGMTLNLQDPTTRAAISEEREVLRRFLLTVKEAELKTVQPLPFRRVLLAPEAASLWQRMRTMWGISGYWIPLDGQDREDAIAFAAPEFHRELGASWLRATLITQGVSRCYELREFHEHGSEYVMEPDAAEFRYNGAEGFWCGDRTDWIVYASHEESITLGGGWLVAAAKAAWPEWEANLWSDGGLDA